MCTDPSVSNLSEVSTPIKFERPIYSDNEAHKKNCTKKLKFLRKGSIKLMPTHKRARINLNSQVCLTDAHPSTENDRTRNDIKFDGSKRIILVHNTDVVSIVNESQVSLFLQKQKINMKRSLCSENYNIRE